MPLTFMPMRLPWISVAVAPVATLMPMLVLPEIVLPANGPVPPMVLFAPITNTPKPFGKARLPLAPTPDQVALDDVVVRGVDPDAVAGVAGD